MNSGRPPVHPVVSKALDRLGTAPGLAPVRESLIRIGEGLVTSMRVALVGRVSAGKSTLANALLGGYRAPTGVNELTYNVNWITKGAEPTVSVHFKDGRAPEQRDVAELERLTVRADGDDPESVRWRSYLESVEYLKITDSAPYLDSFDLVDTPGFDSWFASDSANTLRFLDGPVDAVVLVFSRALHAEETALLRRLRGTPLAAGPINTIGVLTHVEGYWSWPNQPDPHREARKVVEQARTVPGVSQVIYELMPVATLVGAAATTLSEEDLVDLGALSKLPVETLGRSLRGADRFATRDLPVTPERRQALHRMLRGYGIMLACDVIREGVSDLDGLRAALDQRSGMADFRQLLLDHFGSRADLLKLNRAYSRVQALPEEYGAGLGPRDRVALTDAMREFIRHGQAQNPRFRELEVLRQHYDGKLSDLASGDVEDLLRIVGERGVTVAARLGLPAEADHSTLHAQARVGLRRWAVLDTGGYTGPARFAVSVARRAYERLIGELNDARNGADG